jgi:hypothetical protein
MKKKEGYMKCRVWCKRKRVGSGKKEVRRFEYEVGNR